MRSTEPAEGQAAGNPSSGVKTAAQIEAEVTAMTSTEVFRALAEAGLESEGAPKVLRQRLIDHRLSEPF